MKLRGIDFGNVFGASGVQGFFGEGYWFHKLGAMVGMSLKDITFVAKTATECPREGNMVLTRNKTPKHWFPDCVKVKFLNGLMLNSVGLSNIGLWALLMKDKWQERTEPFLISIMAVEDTPQKPLDQIKAMVDMIGLGKDKFYAPFGLQINLSCPNTGHGTTKLIEETEEILEKASILDIPLMPKYSAISTPVEAVMELNNNPHCDAICVSNTFAWSQFDTEKVWGSKKSPLAHLGGGGLSGAYLRPFVCEWIMRLREEGFTKPINGGGGILCANDVNCFHDAGASSIFIGSVVALRPWRGSSIIKRAQSLEWRQ